MTHGERMEVFRRVCEEECEKVWPDLFEAIRKRVKKEAPGTVVRRNFVKARGGIPYAARVGPKPVGPGRVDPAVSTYFVEMPVAAFEWPFAEAEVSEGR